MEKHTFYNGSYLLRGSQIDEVDADYRFDAKARVNANLGSVLNVSPKFDLYPGLNLGLKNFGGHLGARHFFTNGFGVLLNFQFQFQNMIQRLRQNTIMAHRLILVLRSI